MKHKEYELILQLFDNEKSYVTAVELGEKLSLSERTVRTYINQLNSLLEANGAEIVAKQGLGFKLCIQQTIVFEKFLNRNRQKLFKFTHDCVYESGKDKRTAILNKLLLENECLYLDDLADMLYISRSALNKELAIIRKLLEKYSLSLTSKTKQGTCIDGDESDKRAFILDYFFKGNGFNSIQEYESRTSYFHEIPTANLIMVVMDECRDKKIKLSDVMIQNVLLHLMLSIKRVNKGLQIKKITVDDTFFNTTEFEVAKNIISRLEDDLSIIFPVEETAYLTLHLGAKNNRNFKLKDTDAESLQNEIHQVLMQLDSEKGFTLANDCSLKESLMEHFKPMFIRIQQGIDLQNPLLQEIKADYKQLFDQTKEYLGRMPSLHSVDVSDDEWAYLTLHFMAAIERVREKSKLRVLVICATGIGSAELLKSKLKKEFYDTIHIVAEIGYYELSEKELVGVDLIISTVNMNSVIFTVPFIHVSVFLSEKDKNAIRKFIDHRKESGFARLNDSEEALTMSEKTNIFDAMIQKENFTLCSQSDNKETLVDKLIHHLSKSEEENYSQRIKTQIHLREKMGTLVFSDSIAVPHPAIPVGEQSSIAIALCKDGLYWNEKYQDIKFVFLLSPSYLSNEGIRYITKTIVKLIEHQEKQDVILENCSFEMFRQTFIDLM